MSMNLETITTKEYLTRKGIVFRDTAEREMFLDSYNFGKEDAPEAMVDARKLVTAIKMLKDKLYQDRF